MGTLLQMFIFFWISVGFLLFSVKSEACSGFPICCEFEFEDVCFEFVEDLKTWSQARSSCENQGGKLLHVMDRPVEVFLNNISGKKNTSNLSWWLEKKIQNQGQDQASDDLCTYMKLNPLQVTKSECNQTRGFICTHILQPLSNTENTVVSKREVKPRVKRDMASAVPDFLRKADRELLRMERTVGQPSNNDTDKLIQNLLDGTMDLQRQDGINETVNHVINCSTAILLLAMKKCDTQNDEVPTDLYEQIFEIFRVIANSSTNVEDIFVVQHPTGFFHQITTTPSGMDGLRLGSEEEGDTVMFPSLSTIQPFLQNYPVITAQLTTFSHNPHPTSENISGTVCNVILNSGGSDIRLTGLTERIEIFLARPGTTSLTSNSVILEKNTKSVTRLNISDSNTTIFYTVEPSTNVTLFLNLSYGTPTNPEFSANTTVLTHADNYRWVITPEMLRYTPGNWYIDAKVNSSQWAPNLTLKIMSYMTKCLYWDTISLKWSVDGCMVGEKTTPYRTHCLCNHLTLFGSSFFVMPNHVDISQTAELFATVNENYVVLALLCVFFGLYLMILAWACFADRKARSQRKMTLLEDNHPGAQYNYLISVQTGHRKNGGTSASVTVMLTGTEGESRIYDLADPDKRVFERGSVDMFLLATPFPLGDIQNIRLQHDNSGGSPSWYINKVVIQDLQTRYVWHFLCSCWLSDDCGDGLTKKTFNAAKQCEIANFRNIFQNRTTTGFRDEHIWVSIVDPPSRSPFTRAQRISCCMSLLLCTMAINIAFWNVTVDDTSGVIFSMGSIAITWKEFMIGVQSGLLMFPINILIITIFRSIRPRIVSKTKNEEFDVQQPPVTVPTVLKETEEVFTLMSKSPRNKALEVKSLETLADLLSALDKMHGFIQVMQGESESDPHTVHCSRFLLAGLCKLLLDLEKLDIKHFSSSEEHQQILSLTSLLVRKTEMVFSCHLSACPTPVKRKRKSSSYKLPWWFVFLGWFLLLSIAVVSTFFTLLYGFEYGREKSIKWVMSLGLSLFQSIFILQPLKVIGLAVVFALLLKPVAVEETEEVNLVLLEQQKRCSRYCGRVNL